MRRSLLLLSASVPIVLALACGGGGTPTPAVDNGPDLVDTGTDIPDSGPVGEDVTPSETDVSRPDVPDVAVDTPADVPTPDAEIPTQEWPPCVDGDEPGCPCKDNADCASSYCVQTGSGKVCTASCTSECPKGWSCQMVNNRGPDVTYICVPLFSNLCRPCKTGEDCAQIGGTGGLCIDHGAAVGKFCGGNCGEEQPCPSGYACKSLEVEGKQVKQCWPDGDECGCNESAKADNAATMCSKKNDVGTCLGERRCEQAGLSACNAPDAKVEECNGLDDDCDGQTDEEGGVPCEKTNAFGTCKGTQPCVGGTPGDCSAPEPAQEACDGKDNNCDGLTDEGFPDTDADNLADCIDTDDDNDGILDPKDICPLHPNPDQADMDRDGIGDACDSDIDGDGWPNEEDCAPLDAAITCTVYFYDGDDDGTGVCDVKKCLCAPQGAYKLIQCNDNDCLDSDATVGPGKAELCDKKDNDCNGFTDDGEPDTDSDGLKDECDPDDDNDKVPDDKDNCPLVFNPDQEDKDKNGVGDICDGDLDGDGIPNGLDNCPEVPNPLQEDCDFNNKGDACDDEGDDVVGAADCAPCDPEIHPGADERCNGIDDNCNGKTDEAFEDLGKPCDGPDDDKCPGGKWICKDDGTGLTCDEPGEGSVELCDGIDNDCDGTTDEECACTVVVCVGGVCSTKPVDCDDKNPCTADGCDPASGCYHDPTPGVKCDDANPCTSGDVCVIDQCTGTLFSCDDKLDCTLDKCLGDGTCDNAVKAGSCVIDGVCYPVGTINPFNVCQACDPAKAIGAWSELSGTCDDGNACTKDDRCNAGVCGGTAFSCDDGFDCTVDVCDGKGGCTHNAKPGSCAIDDVCYADGAANPENACQVCNIAKSTSAWTNLATGTTCDDGNPCTKGETCKAGACVGTPYTCADGKLCTADVCDGKGGCDFLLNSGSCLIAGKCWDGGAVDPDSVCRYCDPVGSPTAWASKADGTACSDGTACTSDDACTAGICVGKPVTCNDDNVCTDDSCDDKKGCVFANTVKPCNDGNFCTINDLCAAGKCEGTTRDCSSLNDACNDGFCDAAAGACAKKPKADGTSCDDSKLCTGPDTCKAGVCSGVIKPGCCTKDQDCDDSNACTLDTCNVGTGNCTQTPLTGASCDDGQFCTIDDVCKAGKCGGAARDCSGAADTCNTGACDEAADQCVKQPANEGKACATDNDVCTDDVCQGGTCAHPFNTAACDDKVACTFPDTCNAGKCGGQAYTCNDSLDCTDDVCDGKGGCTATVKAGFCLIGGKCWDSAAVNPENACQECKPTASASAWSNRADATACDDGNACTKSDVCKTGACAGTEYTCDDSLSCTDDVCDGKGGCTFPVKKDVCVINGECIAAGTTNPDNSCQECQPATTPNAWVNKTNGAVCNDGNACSKDDKCTAGACKGTAYSCDDSVECTADVCDGNGGCTHPIRDAYCMIGGECFKDGDTKVDAQCMKCLSLKSQVNWTPAVDGTICDDGIACTKSDVCTTGVCGGSKYSCDDGKTCTQDVCDGKGGCTHPQVADTCLIGGLCWGPGQPNPASVCQICDPASSPITWTAKSNGTACEDGNACTSNDQCTGGACLGSPVFCNDNNVCTDDSCDTKTGCVFTPNVSPCSDGLFCTVNDQCQGGKCVGSARDCAGAGDQCNTGVCSEDSDACAKTPKADGTDCDDTRLCTGPDKCTAGKCSGPLKPNCCTNAQDCDDNNVCTKDTCDVASGTCTNAPLSGTSCDDALFCTINDTCSAGTCKGVARDCSSVGDACNTGTCNDETDKCEKQPTNDGKACATDGNVCTDDVCAGGTCMHNNNTLPCDDGKACTYPDVCNAGACGGSAYTCNDNLACTDDVCDGVGGCKFTLRTGFCIIDNTCYADQAPNPLDSCKACLYLQNTKAWSNRPAGTGCDDGNTCTGPDLCDGQGRCAGATSKDSDGDKYVDAACGGNDCNDQDATIHPGVPDPFEGITPVTQAADAGGYHGYWLSAAADSTGKQHMASYNVTNMDLEYTTNRDGYWATAIIDSVGDVGKYAAIAVDGSNKVHIAYYDDTNNDLKYATNASGTWVVENATADTTNDSGHWAAIAVSTDGSTVHVMYRNVATKKLNYRKRVAGKWSAAEAPDPSSDVGNDVVMTLDSKGFIHAAYQDTVAGSLKYITNLTGSWVFVLSVMTGSPGQPSAIAMDGADNPHILFRDLTGYDVKHVWKEGTNWKSPVIVVDGNASNYPTPNRWGLKISKDGHLTGCFLWYASGYYRVYRVDYANKPWGVAGAYVWTQLDDGQLSNQSYCTVSMGPGDKHHVFWHDRGDESTYHITDDSAVPGWEQVDGYQSRGYWSSIARGADGTLHVVYYDSTANQLRYARKTVGSVWETEQVDKSAANLGQYASIAVDGKNFVHIAYYDDTGDDLKYIRGTFGNWGTPEVVDTAGSVGQYTSVIVDSFNAPYIAYYNVTSADLKFARKVGSTWLPETLDNVGSAGTYTAAVMGSDGTVHIAYRTNTNGSTTGNFTRYLRGVPGVGWNKALNIDVTGTSGEWIDIALDSKGYPHVSEYSSSGGEIRHLYAIGNPDVFANWKMEVVTTNLNGTTAPGTYTSIGLDKSDNVYVSFWANGLVVGMRDSSSVWWFTTPDPVGAQYTSIAVAPTGEWHVSYLDSTWATDLRYASNTLRGYTAADVVHYYSSDVGQYSSVAMGPDGTPHVSYYDSTQTDLKYAKYAQGVWFFTTLEHANSVGSWSSIAAGQDGALHFAYYDATNVALRYGILASGAFQSVQVDKTANTSYALGQYNGIAIGSDNVVHISYYDDYNDDLKHAYGSLAKFTLETLDYVNSTGLYSSIAVDGKNAVHIAYQYNQSSGQDTRYITNKTGKWTQYEAVDTTNCQGEWTSIAADAQQMAHISYKDCTGLDLKYASNKTGQWLPQALDTSNNVGAYTSIALNSAGLAYIGYQDVTYLNTRLGTNLSGAWQYFDVDTPNSVGYFTHLAVGPDKKAYMGYYDASYNDLRTAIVTLNNLVDQNCDGF